MFAKCRCTGRPSRSRLVQLAAANALSSSPKAALLLVWGNHWTLRRSVPSWYWTNLRSFALDVPSSQILCCRLFFYTSERSSKTPEKRSRNWLYVFRACRNDFPNRRRLFECQTTFKNRVFSQNRKQEKFYYLLSEKLNFCRSELDSRVMCHVAIPS